MLWTIAVILIVLWLLGASANLLDAELQQRGGLAIRFNTRPSRMPTTGTLPDSSDSGTTITGDIWSLTGEGEAFGEEGVSKWGKIA